MRGSIRVNSKGFGILLGVLVLLSMAGCSVSAPTDAPEADATATEAPTEVPGPKEYNVPADAAALVNPIAADQASLERGKEIYESACLRCHGEEGRGDGPSATEPDDFREPYVLELSDGELFYLITNGIEGSDMQAFNYFDDDQRWHLVNYIRALQE